VLLIIPLLSPLILAIMILNKLLYPKYPVFYSHTRIGKGEKPFKLYKFRTMVDAEPYKKGAEELSKYSNIFHVSKDEHSKKITAFGAVLRKFYLDELPQLYNVLKGDMSLIGPRPVEEYHLNLWRQLHPELHNLLKARFIARPGVTGPWQIHNKKFDLTDREIIQKDIDYIEKSSLTNDLRLAGMTITRIFGGAGE